MFGNDFYHAQLRKFIVVFGTLFNDIVVSRTDSDGGEDQRIRVPISYGPRERWLARVEEDPNALPSQNLTMPRIAFVMRSMNYAPVRKLPSTIRIAAESTADDNQYDGVYVPVPYNLDFEVSILANRSEDALRIVEQIVPFFTPDWTVTVKILDEMPDIATDCPVELVSISNEDTYDQGFEKRRMVIWQLAFTMKVQLYGPVRERKIIKIAETNFYANTDVGNTLPSSTVTIRPGLTANGEPTTVLAESVSIDLIDEDDDWGYIITHEEWPDA